MEGKIKLSEALRLGRPMAKFTYDAYLYRATDGTLCADDLGAIYLGLGGDPKAAATDDSYGDSFYRRGYMGEDFELPPAPFSSQAISFIEEKTGIEMCTPYKSLGLPRTGVDDWLLTLFDWFEVRNINGVRAPEQIRELEKVGL